MNTLTRILKFKILFLLSFFLNTLVFAENNDIFETLEIIKKDIKTLEKAVYSESIQSSSSTNYNSNVDNSEDVLTRHLLKLSEIENQFQQLTNKFEEINFKLDKLSNRLSKVQADNQMRFKNLESGLVSSNDEKQISKKIDDKNINEIPGS